MVHEDELTAGQEMVEDSSCLLCPEQNLHGNRWEQGWVNSRQLLNYNGTSNKGPSKTGTTSTRDTYIKPHANSVLSDLRDGIVDPVVFLHKWEKRAAFGGTWTHCTDY